MKSGMDNRQDSQKVQGEGDYEAAERYGKSVREFTQSGKVDEASKKAKPATPDEAKQLKQAESDGLSHSRGEDPVSPRAPARKP